MMKINGRSKTLLCWILVFLVTAGHGWSQNDSGYFFTSFDGTKIHYRVAGNGQPVILIQGMVTPGKNRLYMMT